MYALWDTFVNTYELKFQITVITEVTVNCAGLKVLKNQWNLTTEVLKVSLYLWTV